MKIPIVSSADAATLAALDLVEALQNPTPNTPFEKFNDKNHTALINLAEVLNIIPIYDKYKLTRLTWYHQNPRFWKRLI